MSTRDKFLAAVEVINSLSKNGPFQPSEEMMLKFSSYHKQATIGPCTSARPAFFDYRKKEWHAWKNLGQMSKEEAMKMYVDQLSKVIETMSYTEAVSKFIDLMGPFYEIVWPEDLLNENSNSSYEIPTSDDHIVLPSGSNSPCCDTYVEDAVLLEELPNSSEGTISTYPLPIESFVDAVANHSRKVVSEDLSIFLDSSDRMCSLRDHLVTISKAAHLSSQDNYANEVLSASVLNLQKSLDDIIVHLDSLESLAKKYQNQILVIKDEDPKKKWWHLSPLTIALVIFWPFVVHWIIHMIRQHKRNVT